MAEHSRKSVGILGGGQLARMLAEAALRLGLRPVAFSEEEDCPAAEVCVEVIPGRVESSSASLRRFLAEMPVVCFENEFVDCDALEAATPEHATKFFPRLPAIRILQDKLNQKKLLSRLGIPTSPFIELDPGRGFAAEIARAFHELQGAIVLKWSRLGYDGKGVRMVSSPSEPEIDGAVRFCEAASGRGIAVFAEGKIDFARELAIIGCASTRGSPGGGEVVCYPLVISEQEGGICRRVVGPARLLGVDPTLETQAIQAAEKTARGAGLSGAFGIEFFETRPGELLVNEIAPRVHNTGHYTQNAFPASQFENHWRAILELPLFDPRQGSLAPFFAMLNLLGPAGLSFSPAEMPLPVPAPSAYLHWYGKREFRPGRKLGHLNATSRSAPELEGLLKELEIREKAWIKELRKLNSL